MLPWPAGATTSNSAVGVVELNGPQTFGGLNGVNVVFEPTDWNPSLATAISGPRSRPQGCSRLRAGTITCPESIVVEPGSLPLSAIWSHVA